MNTFQRAYDVVLTIPSGKVSTYGDVGKACGVNPRVVGYALHANPMQGVVPCHRVVNREGRLAPGFAFGGSGAQQVLLQQEGVQVVDGYVDLKKYGYKF